MYDIDMKVYVDGIQSRGGEWTEHAKRIEANIALMKKWRAFLSAITPAPLEIVFFEGLGPSFEFLTGPV